MKVETMPFLVLGSSTDVGKTQFCAAAYQFIRLYVDELQCHYLKPVQTGYPEHSDLAAVIGDASDELSRVGWTFPEPLSPHVCAQKESQVPSDSAIASFIRNWVSEVVSKESGRSFLLVEGAGGVLSPLPSGSPLLEGLRPLRLPVVLVGNPRLGGISETLCAAEAIMSRGYDIAAVVLFTEKFGNKEWLASQSDRFGASVFELPLVLGSQTTIRQLVETQPDGLKELIGHLLQFRQNRCQKLKGLESRARRSLWWPFTQHADVESVSVIDSAFAGHFQLAIAEADDQMTLRDERDASCSWWTLGLGHGDPQLALQVARAIGRYGHVLFPENVHNPAIELAEQLLAGVGRGFASRVFYSDNGSTAVEVALKMAFRLRERRQAERISAESQGFPMVIGLMDSYHGDTLAAMNATSSNPFTERERWYQPTGIWLSFPRVSIVKGKLLRHGMDRLDFSVHRNAGSVALKQCVELTFSEIPEIYDLESRLQKECQSYAEFFESVSNLLDDLERNGHIFGALLIEPVVHGSAGMLFVDPLFQRALVDVCKSRAIPVIFDEVFSGFYRLGPESAQAFLGVAPDLACYSKSLTGGVLPLAATLASEEVFEGFYGGGKANSMLHGHSYTAHPAGCAAALESLKRYRTHLQSRDSQWFSGGVAFDSATAIHLWDRQDLNELSLISGVQSAMALGTVLAVTLEASDEGYLSSRGEALVSRFRQSGINMRPLGNVLYVMLHPVADSGESITCLRELRKVLTECLST